LDTKLKKSKPFKVWICFFLAVSILAGLLAIALIALLDSDGVGRGWKDPFLDYRDSVSFKQRTADYFDMMFFLALGSSDSNDLESSKNALDEEGQNIKYCVVNRDSGLILKNIKGDLSSLSNSGKMPVLPEGYKYFWYFDGHKLWVIDDGKPVDIQRMDSGYRDNLLPTERYPAYLAKLAHSQVLLAVKDDLVQNPYGHSSYYQEQQLLSAMGWIYGCLLIFGLLLLAYTIIRRPDKREFDRKLASWSGWMWLEVKILLSLLVLTVSVGVSSDYFGAFDRALNLQLAICPLVLGLWCFYLMLLDLHINGKKFFTHNSINALLTWYRQYEKKYSWHQAMLKRAYGLVAIEAILALLSVLFLITAIEEANAPVLLVAFMIAGAGLYLIYRYLKRYDDTLGDLGRLMDHIELIKNGDMDTRLEAAADADIYPAAQNLNFIQEGMNAAVAEKVKSEHMKVELITNVSHDLKTPLTSIISYVDLLQKEEDLPEHVGDYIKILAHKSERLKNLIQDLFDLSKASSDNLNLNMEQIDLARLIKQTLADMEEPVKASGLTLRCNIPDDPVCIRSDGKKLYRVWENLISNALKYSLTGSRVFIDLTLDGKDAVATIKNTANYEMNFTEEEILQRFVRGDEARTTEGSGLGLSIAQSFTQICGGKFAIKIDGDLFKVELRFTGA
jgi:signal transduction histidine kinase